MAHTLSRGWIEEVSSVVGELINVVKRYDGAVEDQSTRVSQRDTERRLRTHRSATFGSAHDGDSFVAQRARRKSSRQPVDGVSHHPWDGVVVLGRGDQ